MERLRFCCCWLSGMNGFGRKVEVVLWLDVSLDQGALRIEEFLTRAKRPAAPAAALLRTTLNIDMAAANVIVAWNLQ